MSGDLNEPVGAIWLKNWKLKDSIQKFIQSIHPVCENCNHTGSVDIDQSGLDSAIKSHTLSVKVKSLKEKFIAIENTKKKTTTQPDYFLHVYQAHTGAAPSYPFRVDEEKRH